MSQSGIVAKTNTVIISFLISYNPLPLSSYPVGRASWIVWFSLDFLQISVVSDTLPQYDGVLHQGEEDEHHTGQ